MWFAVVRLKWQLGVTKINTAAPNSNNPEMFTLAALEVTLCIWQQWPYAYVERPYPNS
jgi:hypothetical protein